MRLGVEVAPLSWCAEAMAINAMTNKSTKPREALLTILSLEDAPIRVKRFYER